jgi:MoaE-MoaD fusion protein
MPPRDYGLRDTLATVIMRVRVLFFGMLKDLAGKSGDLLDLPESASVADVLAHYQGRIPRFKDSLPSLAVAVNQQYAGQETKLKLDDEVALLPPVSGGSGKAAGETPAGQPAGRRRHASASIVRSKIDTQGVLASIKRGEDGAAVVFEGVVRNQTHGRKTLYLDYEAYEEMALQQMEALAEQSLKQFQIRDVTLVHRLGRLEIGETSVLVVVASAHRAAAFDACRWLIDTLKRTVPIWKKEYFEDGAVWADGEPFPAEILRANPPG